MYLKREYFVNLGIDLTMRYLISIFLLVLVSYSCVKRNSTDPHPTVEFKDFLNPHKTSSGEAAYLVLTYEDGDGDLFVDNATQGPNLVFTTYIYNSVTGKFAAHFDNDIQDTLRYSTSVKQPAGGYYKGKAIRGEIWVPLSEFRPNSNAKILQFRGFMIDQKKHKTKIFASTNSYTIDF